MQHYELMFAVRGTLNTSESQAVTDKIVKTLEKHGGTISYQEAWGKMPLAYSIKKEDTAYFFVLHFEISGQEITALEEKFEINPDVIRYLTTKREKEDEIFTKAMYDDGLSKYYADRKERQQASLPKTRATTTALLESKTDSGKKPYRKEASVSVKKESIKEEPSSLSREDRIQEILDKDLSL